VNLELVRHGCVHPATQTSGDGQKLEVSQTDYDAFVNKVTQAAKYAQEHKLGGWGEPPLVGEESDKCGSWRSRARMRRGTRPGSGSGRGSS
jgi:hypothetical protein